jgi:hypothetical protein
MYSLRSTIQAQAHVAPMPSCSVLLAEWEAIAWLASWMASSMIFCGLRPLLSATPWLM